MECYTNIYIGSMGGTSFTYDACNSYLNSVQPILIKQGHNFYVHYNIIPTQASKQNASALILLLKSINVNNPFSMLTNPGT